MTIQVFLQRPHRQWPVTREEWLASLWTTRTGRRLRTALGPRDEPVRIDNLMPFGSDPSRVNTAHIVDLLSLAPRVVLAFSAQASRLIPPLWSGPLVCARHPNTRYLVNGDPLFYAIRDALDAGVRVRLNRDRHNRITEEPV